MGKDRFVIIVDKETQSLIINSLLLMRDEKQKEGVDIGWISEAIVNVCNAPEKKDMLKGECYER